MSDQRDPQTHAIIGAAIEVHKTLGRGFLEIVYHKALEEELKARAIPFEDEVFLPILCKGRLLECTYRADFICYDEILLELKALDNLDSSHRAQVLNYLKATELKRALLINFGDDILRFERIVRDY